MTVTYGFYNSINGDRPYNSRQMSTLFEGVILDGVFRTIGDKFAVSQNVGMTVQVGTGRAWFNATWTYNDALLPIILQPSEQIMNRIDAIVLEVNLNDPVRANRIFALKGTPTTSTSPSRPVLSKSGNIYQHALAYIYVGAGVTSITNASITNVVGMAETPFVTAPMETASLDYLYQQWEAQFLEWFSTIAEQLEEDVAGALLNMINQVKADVALIKTELTLVTQAEAEAGTSTAKRGWSPERVAQSAVSQIKNHIGANNRMIILNLTDPINGVTIASGVEFTITRGTVTVATHTTNGIDKKLILVLPYTGSSLDYYTLNFTNLLKFPVGYNPSSIEIPGVNTQMVTEMDIFKLATTPVTYPTSGDYTILAPCLTDPNNLVVADFCLIGGGGRGGPGTGSSSGRSGAGGAGGGLLNILSKSMKGVSKLTMVIGAGSSANATRGGTTSLTANDTSIINSSILGGNSGTNTVPGAAANGGGAGGASATAYNVDNAGPGTNGSYIFNDSTVGRAVGGGAGSTWQANASVSPSGALARNGGDKGGGKGYGTGNIGTAFNQTSPGEPTTGGGGAGSSSAGAAADSGAIGGSGSIRFRVRKVV